MTISSTVRKAGPYVGTGLVSSYVFAFKVFQASDVLVQQTDTSGNITTLALTSAYTVSLNSDQNASPGGTVNLVTALPTSYQLVIGSQVSQLQSTVITNNGGFYPTVVTDALDKLTILVQQQQQTLNSSLQLPFAVSGVSTVLPVPAANNLLTWNSAATALQSTPLSQIATQIAYGTSAAQQFSGTGSQTAFVLPATAGSVNNVQAFVSGVRQYPTKDYTLSGDGVTVTFLSAPSAGTSNILISYQQGLSQGYTDSAASSYLPSGTGAVASTVQTKLRESVSVKDFGAKGDGTTDDTAALQAAMTAAGAAGVPLQFAGATYLISASVAYALTAPASIILLGVAGTTTIKLNSASVSCHMIGRSTASTYFRMEGITLDGNSSVVSAVNVDGLYFPEATTVISRNNSYKNLNDTGGLSGGKAVYVSNTSLAQYAESTGDQYLSVKGNPFQTYRTARNLVRDCYCTGALTSFTDINGQTLPSTNYVKTQINNNVVICDAAFPVAYSVLSLFGNDIECVGNKINGGGVQIVVHTGTTDTLYNYVVSGNFLWQAKGSGIWVNQSSGTTAINGSVVVSNNTIYQPTKDGIAVIGNYAGGSTTPQATVSITGNVIYDYLTDNPTPGAFACIRLNATVNCAVTGNSIAGPRWAGIYCEYDGRNIVISNNVIADHQGRTNTGVQAGGPIFVSAANAVAYLGNINIIGNTIRNWATQATPVSSVRTGAIVVNEIKASDISIRGNRMMTGNTSGLSLYACVNVTAQDNEVTGFYSEALNTVSGIGANCQLTYAVSGRRYDTTANRPTLQSTQSGYQYWDSTLAKPIWWNGSVWKDAANATV